MIYSFFFFFKFSKGWVTCRFSYIVRHNDPKNMTSPPPPTPFHLLHSKNFDKIGTFLKLVLNICILGNLIVRRGGWVIKEGAGILHQICRFSGGVNIWGRIHQSKRCHSLGLSQTSKVDFFAEIVFSCKPLTFFINCYNLGVWLVP